MRISTYIRHDGEQRPDVINHLDNVTGRVPRFNAVAGGNGACALGIEEHPPATLVCVVIRQALVDLGNELLGGNSGLRHGDLRKDFSRIVA